MGENSDVWHRDCLKNSIRNGRERVEVSFRVPTYNFQLTNFCSPETNKNLLTRSEVVALINTLHRLTESLHFVSNFRSMWADAPEDVSRELIKEAEKAVAGRVRRLIVFNSLLSNSSLART